MVTQIVHTLPDVNGFGWVNRLDDVAMSKHWTRFEAIEAGRALAREHDCEQLVYKIKCSVGERWSARSAADIFADYLSK